MTDTIARIEQGMGIARFAGWQFAADGKWDAAARILDSSDSQQTIQRVKTWLQGQATDNIAFEALFDLQSGERFFFGVRVTHLSLDDKSRVFVQLLTSNHKGMQLGDVVKNIRHALNDPNIAITTPDYLELGVFDLWNRVKSLVVWRQKQQLGKNSAIIQPEEMIGKTMKPDDGFQPLHAIQPMPLMLEAAWARDTDNGVNYQSWVSLPVSQKTAFPVLDVVTRLDCGQNIIPPAGYALSPDRYFAAAATFLGRPVI